MIRQIRLRNFKSFVDETVDFGAFSMVYGANGVGKSNLTDALRLLRSIGEGRSIRDAIEGHASALGGPTAAVISGIRGGAQNLTNFGTDSNVFRIDVKLSTQLGIVDYSIAVDAREYKVVREELRAQRLSSAYVYSTDPDGSPLHQSVDSPAILARYYKNSPGRNPSRSFSAHEFILSQFSGRKAETVGNERWADVARRILRGITPLELRPEVLRQYSSLGRFEFGEHGENFAAVAWRLLGRAELPTKSMIGRPLTFSATRDQLEELAEAGEDVVLDDDVRDARGRITAICSWLAELTPRPISGIAVEYAPTNEVIFSVYEDPYEKPLNARILSDGTLRLAALSLALLGDDEAKTFVIEEVENGINPSRVQLLLQLIKSATAPGLGKQVVATTHAPSLLDFSDQQLRKDTNIVGWDAEKNTSVTTPLLKLDGLDAAEVNSTLSELLTEGWVQTAVDR